MLWKEPRPVGRGGRPCAYPESNQAVGAPLAGPRQSGNCLTRSRSALKGVPRVQTRVLVVCAAVAVVMAITSPWTLSCERPP
jgi:hypothetical protein